MGSNRTIQRGLKGGLVTVLFSLLLFSGSGFASSIQSTAVDNQTDLSMSYLSQVFGTVGDVVHGTSGQMLGKLFYTFNQGVLVVFGLWLAVIAVMLAFKSANEGSFMGDHRKAATLIFLRIAVGAGLLIPNATTGYTALQGLFMEIVVEGVKLADQTWSYGLNYIDQGGSLWSLGATTTGSANTFVTDAQANLIIGGGPSNPTSTTKDLKFAQQVFASEVCMVASTIANQNNSPSSPEYHYAENTTNQAFYFPGYGNPTSSSTTQIANACGQFFWSTIQSKYSQCTQDPNGAQCSFAQLALSGMVEDLLPAAQKSACYSAGSAADNVGVCSGLANQAPNTMNSEIQNAFYGALLDYVNAIEPLASYAANKANNSAKDFIVNAEKQGWAAAGRYYWDLSAIQASQNAAQNVGTYVTASPSGPAPASNFENTNKTVYDAIHSYVTGGSGSKANVYSNGAIVLLNNANAASSAGATSAPSSGVGSTSTSNIVLKIIFPIVGDINDLVSSFNTSNMGTDPILFLHGIGMKCISLAGDIWFGVGLSLLIVGLASAACNAEYNLLGAFHLAMDWLKPLMMVVAGVFLEAGIMFAFYVPLFPFILFTVGVVGWLILTLEAMAAAPLVCLGLTHPDGQPFVGRAEQALMLMLGVFLRPVLMIIGLIAGMILSYVSLKILVFGFGNFLNDLFSSASSAASISNPIITGANHFDSNMATDMADNGSFGGALLVSMMVAPLMLAVFANMVSLVTMQCFSMIYRLPDYVMRWIGGPREESAGQQIAQQMQGMMSKVGSSASKGISSAGQGSAVEKARGQAMTEGAQNMMEELGDTK